MSVSRIETIVESRFGLDGGAMFGIVPKPLWQRTNPADDNNRIAMAARCLYLETGERRVLVDTGMGSKWSEKEAGIYALTRKETLVEALAGRGIAAEAVTDVVMTHLHFDHAGGLTFEGSDGLRPTFPTATHWVQRENWVWAHAPSVRDAGSYRSENFAPLGDAGVDIRLLDGHSTPFDGLEVIASRGHTPGMQMVKFDWNGQTVVYVADLIPTHGHVPVPYVMGYDVYPLTTCAEKAELLANAVDNDWVVGLEHDPEHAFVRVERCANGRYSAAATARNPEELR